MEGDENVERGNWSHKMDYLLSLLGFAVGLGNVWRFPYLCYRNGGGAFLIPYVIMLLLSGLPLFLMELALGQFASQGPISVWKLSPIFKGVGFAMFTISSLIGIYYIVLLAYSLFYLFASFTSELPWNTGCTNAWNTPDCTISDHGLIWINGTWYNRTEIQDTELWNASKRVSQSEEFWKHYVLDISEGLEHPGTVKWQLALCLFLAWLLIFCCLIKGIKSSGKVVWVTATFPYIVLTILLVRGVTLEGAWDGIKFYLEPKWSKLGEPQVWRDGAIQIFFSLGTSWGQLITLSSYSRFHNNCYRDALVIAVLNCLTSFYAGFAIFSVLGFMANEMGVKVEDVADTGAGLAFVAYPAALARLPISPLWSSLFFVMLLTLGLDSQFAVLEALVTGIVDEFPRRLRSKKMFIVLGMCAVGFLLGLPLVTQGGFYLLQLMDNYSGTFSLLVVAIVECVVVGWVYGCDRFLDDISMMIGSRPCLWWKICWKVLTPLSLLFILIFQFTVYSPTKYGDYTYPFWAEVLGWCMVGVAVLMLPTAALYKVCCAKGTLYERVSFLVEPSWDWGPALCVRAYVIVCRMRVSFLVEPSWDWGPALDRHRDGEVYQFLHGRDKATGEHREMSDFIRTASGGDESTKI
ncbi:sodium- and chloride-dependent glycine transporter 2-like [Branchiostoma floridae]|uniref:Transporter n=1 Tax=Branchiostoma floridae TaxID=7739 RepID=A0A9J7LG29_BRAFL|nr:sodium- and chloride-dependent glycine transporter 2-like [Branchiostoma floridae]